MARRAKVQSMVASQMWAGHQNQLFLDIQEEQGKALKNRYLETWN